MFLIRNAYVKSHQNDYLIKFKRPPIQSYFRNKYAKSLKCLKKMIADKQF